MEVPASICYIQRQMWIVRGTLSWAFLIGALVGGPAISQLPVSVPLASFLG